jgi:type II secretory pathway component PulC
MKRNALTLLVALNVVLVLVLAALWLHRDGSVRNVRWQAPKPITSDYLQMLPVLPERTRVDTARFMSWLERPLFSVTRRPPPPPPPPSPSTPPAPVDTLADAKLLGVAENGQTGAVILHIGGKSRRVRLNEMVDGGWVLRTVQARSATFDNAGQTRTLQLVRAAVSTYTGAVIPVSAPPLPPPPPAVPVALSQAAAAANAAAQSVPPAPPVSPAPQTSTTRRPIFGGP